MRLFDVVRIKLWRELTWIGYLDSIVINCKADGTLGTLILPMTQTINQRLTQGFDRYFKLLFTNKALNFSTQPKDTYDPLIQLGLGAQRNINDFVVSGSVDAFMLKSKLYFNGQVKGQYYPLEGSRTNVYATCGLGTAPQTELLDNSMPAGFSKVNTFVGGGLMWFLNRHIAGVLSGTWYNMYRSQNVQTGIWGTEYATIRSSNNTDYKNIFYIQGQIILTF
ncbi:MAG: hypothetical protein Q4D28_04645 [Prevotellaceae bacterium]|nr:hypothetical protein [Prevotellaceae bacterium]